MRINKKLRSIEADDVFIDQNIVLPDIYVKMLSVFALKYLESWSTSEYDDAVWCISVDVKVGATVSLIANGDSDDAVTP